MNNSLMFFRFDLRTKDNEALFKASLHEKCLPIFILDHDYIKLETTSNFQINFLKQSLFELSHQLKEFNAKFTVGFDLFIDKNISHKNQFKFAAFA